MKLIIKFMIPLILGNVMQQLYIMVDAVIIGQGVGVKALAVVGAADWPGGFVLWAVKGFADGFAVITAIFFGEKDYCNLKKSVNMTILLSVVIGIFFFCRRFFDCRALVQTSKDTRGHF